VAPSNSMLDVAFVVMPFADVERPAIGVSLLQAAAKRLGFTSFIHYFNLDLAEAIGHELYGQLSNLVPSESLVGEWFFADLLFELPPEHDYVAKVLRRHAPPGMIAQVLEARKLRRRFVENCAQKILRTHPRVIGFTTTFHQTCASLAVAKQLKQADSGIPIAFGGANCEGEMGHELLRTFSFIDYVCTREGDVVFPEFLDRYLRSGDRRGGPGLLSRHDVDGQQSPRLVTAMDGLPTPDYVDYFARLEDSPIRDRLDPTVLVETSRGCWWGAKHHCTFCGLNGETMHFRSKSPSRAMAEIVELAGLHGVKRMDFVDNILDMRYFATLIPMLGQSKLELEIFYEVKANLRRDHIAALSVAGVKRVQPGIESFSDQVLALMQKGCTGLQNIQLLRWCAEYDVQPLWNLIAGFPGEDPKEYQEMALLVPLLTHLPPPTGCSPIRLDRFSPLFTRAAEVGLREVRPNPAYYYVFPLGRRALSRLAYFFDFEYPDGRDPDSYIRSLGAAAQTWIATHAQGSQDTPRLDATWTAPGAWRVVDTRACATKHEHRLTGSAARIYTACDRAQARSALRRKFVDMTADEFDAAIEAMVEDKLLLCRNGWLLSLAVMRTRPPSQEDSDAPTITAAANATQQLSCAV
jgi:ribosomal peptide maturation radical SAM protein 1